MPVKERGFEFGPLAPVRQTRLTGSGRSPTSPGKQVATVIVDRGSGEVRRNGPGTRWPGRWRGDTRGLRPQAQRALCLPAALRDLPARPGRLAAQAAGGQPRPGRPARLRRLPLLLQPGGDRGLGAAAVPGARLPAGAGAVDRVPRPRRGPAAGLAGGLAAGRGAVPDGRPGRAQRRRLRRDRRRLRERRSAPTGSATANRSTATSPTTSPRATPTARSTTPPTSLRADLALVRELGRPARRPRAPRSASTSRSSRC